MLSNIVNLLVKEACHGRKYFFSLHLGGLELTWRSILRPALFMENFDDFIGSITVSILTTGLKLDTEIALIVRPH